MPVVRIDPEAEPKVRDNAYKAQTGDASREVIDAKDRMERRLVSDNAPGAELIDPKFGFKLLEFRGRSQTQQTWGPVRQSGELTGVITHIGGKNDPVSVHLQDGAQTFICRAKRDIARELRSFLLEPQSVRVSGYSRWHRDDQGHWAMDEFTITSFVPLDLAPISEVLEGELRAVPSSWLNGSDPLAELRRLRDI